MDLSIASQLSICTHIFSISSLVMLPFSEQQQNIDMVFPLKMHLALGEHLSLTCVVCHVVVLSQCAKWILTTYPPWIQLLCVKNDCTCHCFTASYSASKDSKVAVFTCSINLGLDVIWQQEFSTTTMSITLLRSVAAGFINEGELLRMHKDVLSISPICLVLGFYNFSTLAKPSCCLELCYVPTFGHQGVHAIVHYAEV